MNYSLLFSHNSFANRVNFTWEPDDFYGREIFHGSHKPTKEVGLRICLSSLSKGVCMAKCKKCNGTGFAEKKCWNCQGSGQNNGMKCSVCNGRGLRTVTCSSCGGSGDAK
jgi:hypothetical protein